MNASEVYILWENRHKIENGVYTDSTTTYKGATILDVAEAKGASQLKKELHEGTLDIETVKEAAKTWAVAAGLHFDNYDTPSFIAIDLAVCDMTRSCFVAEMQSKGDFWMSVPESVQTFFERHLEGPIFSKVIERALIFKYLQREGKLSDEWVRFLYRAIAQDSQPTPSVSQSEPRTVFELPINYVSCGLSTENRITTKDNPPKPSMPFPKESETLLRSTPKDPWRVRRVIVKVIACGLIIIGFYNLPEGSNEYRDEKWITLHDVVRWAVFSATICGLWENYTVQRSEGWKTFWGFFFGIAAILFNPFIRLSFEPNVWAPLDFITLIGIALSFFKPKPTSTPTKTSQIKSEDHPLRNALLSGLGIGAIISVTIAIWVTVSLFKDLPVSYPVEVFINVFIQTFFKAFLGLSLFVVVKTLLNRKKYSNTSPNR